MSVSGAKLEDYVDIQREEEEEEEEVLSVNR